MFRLNRVFYKNHKKCFPPSDLAYRFIITDDHSVLRMMITLKGVRFSFIYVYSCEQVPFRLDKCYNPLSTIMPFEWLFLWMNTIVFLHIFYFVCVFHICGMDIYENHVLLWILCRDHISSRKTPMIYLSSSCYLPPLSHQVYHQLFGAKQFGEICHNFYSEFLWVYYHVQFSTDDRCYFTVHLLSNSSPIGRTFVPSS